MNPLKIIAFALLLGTSSWAYGDFGSHFVVNSRLATAIDNGQKKISFRFTCQEDMNVIGLSVFCEEAQIPPAYLISLREDVKGKPTSILLESSSVTPKGSGWVTLPINEVPLLASKVYHVVIEQDINRGGDHPVGVIGVQNFASFAYTDPLNPFVPNLESPDPNLNVLLFEKNQWKVLNREPLFALHGTGERMLGNPYDESKARPIHGNGTPDDPSDDVIQGQALHPHYGFHPKGFAIRVKKHGNPTAPLNYRVYVIRHLTHTTSLAFSGEALRPQQVSSTFQWVTIGKIDKDGPVDFPPECRYVVFQTNSGKATTGEPGCEDCYLLSDAGNSGNLPDAGDLSFDGGAHLSRAVHSYDGWKTWIDEFERDSNVIILGPPPPSATPRPVEQLPTPLPLLRSFTP